MKKSVLMVLAVILVFTGVFTGMTIWQHNRSMSVFAADGYVLGGEAETGVVSCDYFRREPGTPGTMMSGWCLQAPWEGRSL